MNIDYYLKNAKDRSEPDILVQIDVGEDAVLYCYQGKQCDYLDKWDFLVSSLSLLYEGDVIDVQQYLLEMEPKALNRSESISLIKSGLRSVDGYQAPQSALRALEIENKVDVSLLDKSCDSFGLLFAAGDIYYCVVLI